jgi:hypothetical protein
MIPLRCLIKKNSLVIEVGLDVLKFATENHPELYEDGLDKGRYVVTDVAVFAKEVVRELQKEEEDGTTPIHSLLDKAILDAISNGAQGVEEAGT